MKALKKLAALLAVMLVLLPVAASAAEAENLIKNPSFEKGENGYITDWVFDAWDLSSGMYQYYVATDDESGASILCIDNKGENDARLEQDIKTKGNSIYHVSAWVKAEGFSEGATGANVSAMDCFAISQDAKDTDGQWVKLEFYGKTDWFQGSFTMCLRAGHYGNLNQGRAWFKDVQVTKVNEAPQGVSVQSLKKLEAASDEAQTGEGPNWVPLFVFISAICALALYFYLPKAKDLLKDDKKRLKWVLVAGLGAAFVLRLVLSTKFPGYGVDMGCFKGWALRMADVGPGRFYLEGFCDYPPGYMYVLWLIGGLVRLLNIGYDSIVFDVLVRIPAMLADIACAYLIFKLAKRFVRENLAVMGALAYAFLPALWLTSAMWGQVDSILIMLLLLCLLLYLDEKLLLGSLVFALAVVVKPQALMFGTIPFCIFVSRIIEKPKKGLIDLAVCVTSCIALIALLITPFSIGRGYLWIIEKYQSVLTSYPYAVVNAMNLFGVIGGNWVPQETILLGGSYATWGTVFMAVSVVFGLVVYFFEKKPRALLLMVACVLLGVFTLGVRMHERYMLPIIAFVLLAALCYDDKRLLLVAAGLSFTNAVNIFVVLQHEHVLSTDRVLQVVVGVMNFLLLMELWAVSVQLTLRGKNRPFIHVKETRNLKAQVLGPALPGIANPGAKLTWNRWDLILVAALTAVYGFSAFFQLGNTYAPQTLWEGGVGSEVVFDLGQSEEIGRVYYYGEISYGTVEVQFSADGVNYTGTATKELGVHDMFKWHIIEVDQDARYVRFAVTDGDMRVLELAVADEEGNCYALSGPGDAAALTDEQWMVPQNPGYMDSMYFDEVYHGRTAYEQLHNMDWYENTHPPLGKVFMSWSIALFGMTPFGWRFAGTLAGVLMVPAMYYLAKLLFRKTEFAFFASFLMSFDFMHLAQTRIGTIDSYPVLFIILSYAFMIHYAYTSFYHEKLWKTLVLLFFSGVFMGLGIASKWIGAYAAIGLALLFFAILFARFSEYKQAKAQLAGGDKKKDPSARRVVELFPKYALITVLLCVLFFVVIPVLIYVGSYYQFLRIDAPRHGLEQVWDYQSHMLNYHKAVFDSHPYESPWWQWPLILRPIWYFSGGYTEPGTISSIASLGNPAVWWAGFACMLWVIYRAVQGYGKRDKRLYIVILGFCANYLPWVLVPRTTFIYHYFASVPFIILAITLFAEDLYARYKHAKVYLIVYLCLVLGLYVLFYPVLTGIPMADIRGALLNWLPSWKIF